MSFLVLAVSAPSKCSVQGPLPPSPAAVSVSALVAAVRPLRFVPSLPSGPGLLAAWAVCPPPPSSPRRLWDDVRAHGVFLPWGPLPLWGSSRPETTRLPCPLCGAPPRGFLPLRRPRGPPSPPPHSVGLGVHSGGLAAPIVSPYSRGFCPLKFSLASIFSPFPLPRPMADPRPCLVGGRGGGSLLHHVGERRHADGVAMGYARMQGGRDTGGHGAQKKAGPEGATKHQTQRQRRTGCPRGSCGGATPH